MSSTRVDQLPGQEVSWHDHQTVQFPSNLEAANVSFVRFGITRCLDKHMEYPPGYLYPMLITFTFFRPPRSGCGKVRSARPGVGDLHAHT